MNEARGERLFTFRSGGWILALALLLTLIGTAWNLAPLWDPHRARPRGDGRTAASYGFDLATALVPKDKIVSSGLVVDGLPALLNPETLTARKLAELEARERGRYLVPTDKVIGVAIGGEARAYPLRVLVWHEVVNDVVGGVPIAVTYNPLSNGIAVFDRRAGGRTLTFGVSGLLYQSNLLMYDRGPEPRAESLWSQLQARAIAGPAAAAGTTLTVLPLVVTRWDAWTSAWPDTGVLAPIAGETDKYGRDVYGSYLNTDELRFPVDPLPPAGGLGLKTPVFATEAEGSWKVAPLPDRAEEVRADAGSSAARPVAGIYAFWFAWYATHPGS